MSRADDGHCQAGDHAKPAKYPQDQCWTLIRVGGYRPGLIDGFLTRTGLDLTLP